VQYKENQNVCSTTPIRLNVAYSASWSKRKWKQNYSKMVAKLKTKRTSITKMGAKIQAFDIFQTPLSSHYPLPLKRPKHDQVENGFFYTNQTHMVRCFRDWQKKFYFIYYWG
jgi:hypothetical protein